MLFYPDSFKISTPSDREIKVEHLKASGDP